VHDLNTDRSQIIALTGDVPDGIACDSRRKHRDTSPDSRMDFGWFALTRKLTGMQISKDTRTDTQVKSPKA